MKNKNQNQVTNKKDPLMVEKWDRFRLIDSIYYSIDIRPTNTIRIEIVSESQINLNCLIIFKVIVFR